MKKHDIILLAVIVIILLPIVILLLNTGKVATAVVKSDGKVDVSMLYAVAEGLGDEESVLSESKKNCSFPFSQYLM